MAKEIRSRFGKKIRRTREAGPHANAAGGESRHGGAFLSRVEAGEKEHAWND